MWKITNKENPAIGKCVIIHHKRNLYTHTGVAVLVFDKGKSKKRFVCECGGYAEVEDVAIWCELPKINHSLIAEAELDIEIKNRCFDYDKGEWVDAELNTNI